VQQREYLDFQGVLCCVAAIIDALRIAWASGAAHKTLAISGFMPFFGTLATEISANAQGKLSGHPIA
jgi:hypothetical protein